jgi:hypothetical protein
MLVLFFWVLAIYRGDKRVCRRALFALQAGPVYIVAFLELAPYFFAA